MEHCNRPGTCDCGNLGCNCGCYICLDGPAQGLTHYEWARKKKNKIEHLNKLLEAGVTEEDGYDVKMSLWLLRVLKDPDEEDNG